MNTLEIIGLLSLLVWVPTGVVVVVLLIFENTVSPATFGAFLRWYWRESPKRRGSNSADADRPSGEDRAGKEGSELGHF